MSKVVWMTLAVILVGAVPAMAQMGPPPGGGPGFGGPGMGPMGPGMGMMGPPMPMSPPVTMIVADGVVYVACNGTLTAYEAKTLKQLATATFWTPPMPPPGGPMGRGGGQPPVGPPPVPQ